jgi:hypothetical protein
LIASGPGEAGCRKRGMEVRGYNFISSRKDKDGLKMQQGIADLQLSVNFTITARAFRKTSGKWFREFLKGIFQRRQGGFAG